MLVRVHGFDWMVYSERVMPAIARWLVDGEESAVRYLYKQTRSAQGEQFVPDAVKHLCIWPRAQAFVKQLPRGPQALREYQNLCAAELFTALSDRYIRQYPPRIYQDSEALRSVWGAIIEHFCLPWSHLPPTTPEDGAISAEKTNLTSADDTLEADSDELITLLQSAGLDELARQVEDAHKKREQVEQSLPSMQDIGSDDEIDIADEDMLEDSDASNAPTGIVLGRQPSTLHLRGWLATLSVRAMVLFEYLACGRRCTPFGYQAGESFEAYIGYLTPDEIWQLALCLAEVQPPDPAEAREDFRKFHDQLSEEWDESRLIDEVLPAHAEEFLQAVRDAAQQGLGLICSIN